MSEIMPTSEIEQIEQLLEEIEGDGNHLFYICTYDDSIRMRDENDDDFANLLGPEGQNNIHIGKYDDNNGVFVADYFLFYANIEQRSETHS